MIKKLIITLPFKLPTWNQLLAMDRWQRAKLTKWLVNAGYISTLNVPNWRTQTELVLRGFLTDLEKQEYSQMIVPNSLKKLRTRKSLAKLRKQLSQFRGKNEQKNTR